MTKHNGILRQTGGRGGQGSWLAREVTGRCAAQDGGTWRADRATKAAGWSWLVVGGRGGAWEFGIMT